MTTLAPEPRPHPQLASAAGGASLSGVGSGTSVPLNRGLERALEEAAGSGRLNLSNRRLKEFPKSAANYDLTDTVEAGRLRQGPVTGQGPSSAARTERESLCVSVPQRTGCVSCLPMMTYYLLSSF